jgi:hypothetical protein
MYKFTVICVLAITLLSQTAAFAATEFYVTLHDAGRRVHCDSLQMQNSAVQCDDGALTITYDAAAINSITVVSDGRQHDFHHLTQDAVQQINAFNTNKSDSKIQRKKNKESWINLGFSHEPELIRKWASVSTFSDAAELLQNQHEQKGIAGAFVFLLPVIGSVVLLIGGLWYIVAAFRVSILWGLGCLFFPVVGSLIFLFAHWKAAVKPFIVMLFGMALPFLGIFLAEKKENLSTGYSRPKPQAEHDRPKSSFINEKSEQEYTCSGKVYCSEMTSCEEAMFYQHNCPGTKMDGDDDGIPCERQWCK